MSDKPAPSPPFPVWATILTVVGMAVLCGLGTWQVQRLAWKTAMLAQLDALYQHAPQDMDSTAIDQAATAQPDAYFYPRATLQGTLLATHNMLVGPRTADGATGYHLLTPLQMADGAIIIINRGFVTGPVSESNAQKTISGLLRRPDAPNRFVPANRPTEQTWFSIAPAAMSTAHDLPASLPLVLYAESETPPAPAAVMPQDARPLLRNNHKEYAGFWFAMAGVLVAVYLIRFILPRVRRQDV